MSERVSTGMTGLIHQTLIRREQLAQKSAWRGSCGKKLYLSEANGTTISSSKATVRVVPFTPSGSLVSSRMVNYSVFKHPKKYLDFAIVAQSI